MKKPSTPQKRLFSAIVIHQPDEVSKALKDGARMDLTEDGKPGVQDEAPAYVPWQYDARQMALFKLKGHGNCEIVRSMIVHGADFTQAAEQMIYPPNLHNMLAGHHQGEALGVCLDLWPQKFGHWKAWRNHEGKSLLHLFAQEDQLNKVKVLIDRGADLNAVDNKGKTALFYASGASVINLLLVNGADPYIEDKTRKTALKVAVMKLRNKAQAQTRNGNHKLLSRDLVAVATLGQKQRLLQDPHAHYIGKILNALILQNPSILDIPIVEGWEEIQQQTQYLTSESKMRALGQIAKKSQKTQKRLNPEFTPAQSSTPKPKF